MTPVDVLTSSLFQIIIINIIIINFLQLPQGLPSGVSYLLCHSSYSRNFRRISCNTSANTVQFKLNYDDIYVELLKLTA